MDGGTIVLIVFVLFLCGFIVFAGVGLTINIMSGGAEERELAERQKEEKVLREVRR